MKEVGIALIIIPWAWSIFGTTTSKVIIWNQVLGTILVICSYLIK